MLEIDPISKSKTSYVIANKAQCRICFLQRISALFAKETGNFCMEAASKETLIGIQGIIRLEAAYERTDKPPFPFYIKPDPVQIALLRLWTVAQFLPMSTRAATSS